MENTTITIDDKDYVFEDMTQQQQILVKHCADIDNKIAQTQFNMDQLNVSRNAFMSLLKDSLRTEQDENSDLRNQQE